MSIYIWETKNKKKKDSNITTLEYKNNILKEEI